ncbi:PREDICTED: L-type lectin-domain containing receptor kinase VIII.2-like [Tarenaya hassleriana]|uniref:L-type lectin-domain containing receptor kinase VIII.2-like n=1 Tax=Tarenaya hassleriana TaxID=28532 RepID=UPI00053C3727|nr:PREDICTED: L-type lectin-domain containing receptor kinase VIII.2-like [Tarenaya hassleriana]
MAVLKTLAFIVFFLEISGILAADGNSSFTFNGFGQSRIFVEDIALFGDSKVVNGGGSSIQLTDSVSGSEGRVIYRKPIQLFGGKERNSCSFSTYFSFSMSSKIGGVMAFVMFPGGLDLRLFGIKGNSSSGLGFLLQVERAETEAVAVEFSTSKKGSRVGIVVGSPKSAKIGNLSSFHSFFPWNNGEKLSCWIDYGASSKRIEVRLSKLGATKPVDPTISYSIDLVKLWKDGKFMVGLSSINGNSSQPYFLHSWSFNLKNPPVWMHSQPLDPNEVLKTEKEDLVEKPVGNAKKSDCVWRMVSALILGALCGTLGAMLGLYLWRICSGRRPMAVAPEECAGKSVEAVVVEKSATEVEEGKK